MHAEILANSQGLLQLFIMFSFMHAKSRFFFLLGLAIGIK